MPIALTPFEALCGFRPVSEIQYFLKVIPELRAVIGEEIVNNFLGTDEANSKGHLQKCLEGLLTHPADSMTEKLASFLDRLSQMGKKIKFIDCILGISRELRGLEDKMKRPFL